MLNKFFTNMNLYNKSLDASWKKNDAIINNIANANTPGYKRETVEFESMLKQAMGQGQMPMTRTHANHMPLNSDITPTVVKDDQVSFRADGNSVNIDTEMADLADNQIRYDTLVRQLNSSLKRVRISIK